MPFWKLRKRSQKPSPASIPSQSPGNQYENIYDDYINPCKTQKSSQWSKLQHEDVQDSHLKVRGLERELETHNANVKYFTEDLDCSRQEIVEQRKMVRSALKNARKEHLEKLLGRRCQERFEFERRLDTLALSEFLVDHKLDDFTEHTILSKGRTQVIRAKMDGHAFAIKAFSAARSEQALAEAAIHTQLADHSNVMKAEAIFLEEDRMCFVLPLCKGKHFHKWLEELHARKQRSAKVTIIAVLHGIASGLAHLHSAGFIHGNLSSSQILMDGNRPVITGFSLSSHGDGFRSVHDLHVPRSQSADMFAFGHLMARALFFPNEPPPCHSIQDRWTRAILERLLHENPKHRLKARRVLRHQFFISKFLAGSMHKDPLDPITQQCPHYHRCLVAAQRQLDVPAVLRQPSLDVCFCERCVTQRKEPEYVLSGSPQTMSSNPIGWVRLGIKSQSAAANNAIEDWHLCFHGTTLGAVTSILMSGRLAKPGDTVLGGFKIQVRAAHQRDLEKYHQQPDCPKSIDPCQIFVSPSIQYASQETYSTPCSRLSAKKRLKIALEVRIEPHSYDTGPDTGEFPAEKDAFLSRDRLEWFSPTTHCHAITGVMLYLPDVTD